MLRRAVFRTVRYTTTLRSISRQDKLFLYKIDLQSFSVFYTEHDDVNFKALIFVYAFPFCFPLISHQNPYAEVKDSYPKVKTGDLREALNLLTIKSDQDVL